jgi:hypothetical protein
VDLRIFFLLLVERVRKEEETNKRIWYGERYVL